MRTGKRKIRETGLQIPSVTSLQRKLDNNSTCSPIIYPIMNCWYC